MKDFQFLSQISFSGTFGIFWKVAYFGSRFACVCQLVQCRFQLSTSSEKIHGTIIAHDTIGQWQGYARQKFLYFYGIATAFWRKACKIHGTVTPIKKI